MLVLVIAIVAVLVNATVLVPRRSRQQVRQGIAAISLGLTGYARDHGGRFPRAAALCPRKLGSTSAQARRTAGVYLPSWPRNPFSGRLLRAGTQPGD